MRDSRPTEGEVGPQPKGRLMPKFFAYVDGGQGGCDYTIACNKCLYELQSTTFAEALIETEKHLGRADTKRPGIGCGDGYAESAIVIEVASIAQVDIVSWRDKKLAERAAEKTAEQEIAERALLEKLSAKYKK